MFATKAQIYGPDSVVAFIDPLNDFVRLDGPFQKTYGEDALNVLNVIHVLREMAHAWKNRIELVLNKSNYRRDLFKVPGLEELCTTEEGRASVLDTKLFDRTIEKTHNSIITAGREAIDFLLSKEFIALTGMTGTSCITKTANDILQLGREGNRIPKLILPRNAIANRESREPDFEETLQNWREDKRVIVVPRWEDIEIIE